MSGPKKIRKPRNHALRMQREAKAQETFDRNIRKEREIGVHPKYRNSYRRMWSPSVKEWEAMNREWERQNP